ncbi:Hypothetical_protein [Hexamita inflata]|uniref:Hypothetical_protein n=1 Tax=Hexamita inflata TaxID=28002 RepID=A0AA86URW8_9EUKA|nr:Hypothetical protein HINF_LOCUS56925 [Hexamita inflata]
MKNSKSFQHQFQCSLLESDSEDIAPLKRDFKKNNCGWRIQKQQSYQNVLQPIIEYDYALYSKCEQDITLITQKLLKFNNLLNKKNMHFHLYMQKITREIKFRVGSTLDEMNELIIDKKTNYSKRIQKGINVYKLYINSFSSFNAEQENYEQISLQMNQQVEQLVIQFNKCYEQIYNYPNSCYRFNQQIYEQYLQKQGISFQNMQFKPENFNIVKLLLQEYIQKCIKLMKQIDQEQYRLNSPYYCLIRELQQFEETMLTAVTIISNFLQLQYTYAIYNDMKQKLVIKITDEHLIYVEIQQHKFIFENLIQKSKEVLNYQILVKPETNYIFKQKQMHFKQMLAEQNNYSLIIKSISDPQQFKKQIEFYMQSDHLKIMKFDHYNDHLNNYDLNNVQLQFFSDSSDEDDIEQICQNNSQEIFVRDIKYQPNIDTTNNSKYILNDYASSQSQNDEIQNLKTNIVLINDITKKIELQNQILLYQKQCKQKLFEQYQDLHVQYQINYKIKKYIKRICNLISKYQIKIAEQKYTLIIFAQVPFNEFHKQPQIQGSIQMVQQIACEQFRQNQIGLFQIQQIQYSLQNPFAKDFNRLLQFENIMIQMITQMGNISDIEDLLKFSSQLILMCHIPLITTPQQIQTISYIKHIIITETELQLQDLITFWRQQISQHKQNNQQILTVKELISKYYQTKINVSNFNAETNKYLQIFSVLQEFISQSSECKDIIINTNFQQPSNQ